MVVDRWSTHMNISDPREAFRATTLLAYLRRFSLPRKIQFFDVNCCIFMRLHFSIGCYDCRRTPGSRCGIQTFLLVLCIDAPESTTNSLSSGLILDCEERHHFSEGEKKVDLCFSFNFRTFFASFHAASRAQ